MTMTTTTEPFATPPQEKKICGGFASVPYSSPLKVKRTSLASGNAETIGAGATELDPPQKSWPRNKEEKSCPSPRRNSVCTAYSHNAPLHQHHHQQQQHQEQQRPQSPRRNRSKDDMSSPNAKTASWSSPRKLNAEQQAGTAASSPLKKKIGNSSCVESTSLFSPPSPPPSGVKKQVVLPPPQPLAIPSMFNNTASADIPNKQVTLPLLERPKSPTKISARPSVQQVTTRGGAQPPAAPPLSTLDHGVEPTKQAAGTPSSSPKFDSHAALATSNRRDSNQAYSTYVESTSLFSPKLSPKAMIKRVVLPPAQPLSPSRFNNNNTNGNDNANQKQPVMGRRQSLLNPLQSPNKNQPSLARQGAHRRQSLPSLEGMTPGDSHCRTAAEAEANPNQLQLPKKMKKQLILLEAQRPLPPPPSLLEQAREGLRPSSPPKQQPQSPRKKLVQLGAQCPLSPPPSVVTRDNRGRGHLSTAPQPLTAANKNERDCKPMSKAGIAYKRPDIHLRVGSPALDVYNRKLRHDDCVLVPEFFGREDDFSMYHKVLDELSGLQRLNVEGTEWAIVNPNAAVTGYDSNKRRPVTCASPGRSPAVREIIRKVAQYFDLKKSTIQYKLDWYRDGSETRAPGQYSEAFEQGGGHGRNLTVEASFGAEREISLRTTTAKDNDEWASTIVYVPQTNNGIISIGRDVNIRCQNSAIEAENLGNENSRVNVCGRISIIVWGQVENAFE